MAATTTPALTARERALIEPLQALVTWLRCEALGYANLGNYGKATVYRERADQAERELEEAVRA